MAGTTTYFTYCFDRYSDGTPAELREQEVASALFELGGARSSLDPLNRHRHRHNAHT